jgi:hypothetical protein
MHIGRVAIVRAIQKGQHGWQVQWREYATAELMRRGECGIKKYWWTPDVDDAMAIQLGMWNGLSFEDALNDVKLDAGINALGEAV